MITFEADTSEAAEIMRRFYEERPYFWGLTMIVVLKRGWLRWRFD